METNKKSGKRSARVIDHQDSESEHDVNQPEEEAIEDTNDQREDNNDDDELGNYAEIPHKFEYTQIGEPDFHAVKHFLRNYILSKSFLSSEISDIVLSYPEIGTAVRGDDAEGQALAFITALPWNKHKNSKGFQQIKRFILDHAKDNPNKQRMEHILTDANTSVGLLMSERVMNLPLELAPPLHKTLFEDVATAAKKNKDFAFDYYVMITSSYTETQGPSNKKKKKRATKQVSTAVNYFKVEDELYAKAASFSASYPILHNELSARWTFANQYISETGHVFFIPKANISQVLSKIESFVSMSDQ